MDAILQSYIKDFSTEHHLSNKKDSEIFEHFSNYCIIKRESSDAFELDDINVSKDGNPGIDGIAILINGNQINSVDGISFFIENRQSLEVDIILIQSKSGGKFDSGEMLKFLSSARSLTDPNQDESHFEFNEDALLKKQIINEIYNKAINLKRNPSLALYYVSPGKWNENNSTMQFITPEIEKLKDTNLFADTPKFIPIDAEKLRIYYQEIKNKNEKEIIFKDKITLPETKNIPESYLGIIPSAEFLKLITNSDNKISKSIFYDNVRDFQGLNAVNQEMAETLKNPELHKQFCLFNNGVTIVAKSLRVISNKFIIQNYQIVNGCQTSHIIFNNRDIISDELNIPIKIIVTTDYEAMNNIIKATNRQTEVKSEAFESLKPFHKHFEEFCEAQNKLSNYSIHYERRSRQFEDRGIQQDKIITISRLITAYISIISLDPHNTHKYYGELLEYYKGSLFNDNSDPKPYYISAIISKRFEANTKDNNLKNFDKRLKNHVMTAISIIANKGRPIGKTLKDDNFDRLRESILGAGFLQICKTAIDEVNSISEQYNFDRRNRHQRKPMTIALRTKLINAEQKPINPANSESKDEGEITYFNKERGFGFITDSEKSENVFFHISSIPSECIGDVTKGIRVLFRRTTTHKGNEAKEVEFIN